jgi:geranylgeranyl diphosphate synthase type II
MTTRIETALATALGRAEQGAPPSLASALRFAVFPGGARVRPHLCLAVAAACGDEAPALTDGVAAAIELLHCASLVHDDLPCFDNAAQRRGKPAVHRAYGEPLAVLVGDALIVLSFETLALAGSSAPDRLAPLLSMLARAAGAPQGLVAGQAWESEASVPLATYHRAKTGSLFTAATMGGALSTGRDPAPWQALGDALGDAYQIADDLLDAVGQPGESGKPTQKDASLSRPNAVMQSGVDGALQRLHWLVQQAQDAVPSCADTDSVRSLVRHIAKHLLPQQLRQAAA